MNAKLSQRGASNRRKGHDAERAVANYLRANGFNDARRAVAAGWTTATRTVADPGDVTGVPGTIISVKDAQTERTSNWLSELDAMSPDDTLALRLLVLRRKYKADPGQWRCLMRYPTFTALQLVPDRRSEHRFPVELAFGDVVTMLLEHVPPRYRQEMP